MAGVRDQLERYEITERIGVGGMAEVLRAKAYGLHGFEKAVAIKRILPELASDPAFETRFIAEAKVAAGLTHANIVQVFDFGRFQGSLYIAMEFIEGVDLRTLLKAQASRGNVVPLGAAMQIALELCKGLEFAHRRGVVHRDISPSNVLVSSGGEVKVADFGIAMVETDLVDPKGPAQIMGKWAYMSPEQTRALPVDARSDVFSAGVVLHELFTGVRLFDAEDVAVLVRDVREMPIPRPSTLRADLPPPLDDVLAVALNREPTQRYADGSGLMRALLEVSYARGLFATGAEVGELASEAMRYRRSGAALDGGIRAAMGHARHREGSAPTPLDGPPGMSRRTELGAAPGMTLVLHADGPDGLSSLELSSVAEPSGRRSRRPRRRWAVMALGVLSLGALVALVGARERWTEQPVESEPPPVAAPVPTAPESQDVPARRTQPPDAQVTLNGEALGAAPGTPTIAAADAGVRLVKRTGTIDLYAEPWAEVFLGNKKVGEAPAKGLKLPVGRHRLRLVNPVHHRQAFIDVTVPGTRPYRVKLE